MNLLLQGRNPDQGCSTFPFDHEITGYLEVNNAPTAWMCNKVPRQTAVPEEFKYYIALKGCGICFVYKLLQRDFADTLFREHYVQ